MDLKREAKVMKGEAERHPTYSNERLYPTVENAREAMEIGIRKLLNVDGWTDLPGISATFETYDGSGERKHTTKVQVGDLVKILLPGPFPENWVEVTEVNLAEDVATVVVRPCADPNAHGEEADRTEHFFTSDSVSIFKVERIGEVVRASEIGRHEKINNRGEEAGDRKVINTLIAQGGWAFFQGVQWNKLTEYLCGATEDKAS